MKTIVSQEEANKTATEVGELLTAMIQLGGIYFVDDMGFIRSRANPEEAVPVDIDGVNKKLMIYRDKIENPDQIVVLNPFSETQSTSQEKTWFYCTCSIVFSNVVKMVLKSIVDKCVMIKDPAMSAAEDPAYISLLSPYVEEVDAKMSNEIDSIMGNNPTSFITIYYHARTKTAHLKLGLKEPEFKDAFPKVRKKTWAFIEKVITNIFGLNPSYHDYTSNLAGCPHFDAYVHVWYRVYKSLNMFLPFIGINFDEVKLSQYIEGDKIEQYHKYTRWLVQPNLTKSTTIGGKTIVNNTTSSASTATAKPTTPPWMPNNNSEPVWKQMAEAMAVQNQQRQMMMGMMGGGMMPMAPVGVPGMMAPNPLAMMGMGAGMPMGMPQANPYANMMMPQKKIALAVPGYPGL